MNLQFNIDIDNNSLESINKTHIAHMSQKQSCELYDLFVDLGLPSRTLWSKFNLGSNYNTEVNVYENDMHQCNGGGFSFLFGYMFDRYNLKLINGLNEVQRERFKKINDKYLELNADIPTLDQLRELFEYTTQEKVSIASRGVESNTYLIFNSKPHVSGIVYCGIKFTSKVNNNSIVIPLSHSKICDNSSSFYINTYHVNIYSMNYSAFIVTNNKECVLYEVAYNADNNKTCEIRDASKEGQTYDGYIRAVVNLK